MTEYDVILTPDGQGCDYCTRDAVMTLAYRYDDGGNGQVHYCYDDLAVCGPGLD